MDRKPEHGTVATYSNGCRCGVCREAWNGYIRARREGIRVAKGLPSREEALVQREIEQAESKLPDLIETGENVSFTVQLSPLGLQILTNLQRQTGERRQEILESLLRDHGTDVAA